MSVWSALVSGFRVTSLATIFSFSLGLIQTAILARLLDKSDFAWVAIVAVFVNIGIQIQNSSINIALIQRIKNTPQQLSSLFWLNIGISFLLLFIGLLLAVLAGSIYQSKILTKIFMLYCFLFIANGVGVQQKAILQKNNQFKSLAITEITGIAGSFILALVLAWQGWGAGALIGSYILRYTIETLVAWWYCSSFFIPTLHFRWHDLKWYSNFSLLLTTERFITHFATQLDILLITKWLGMESAGVYDVFKRTLLRPTVLLNLSFERVALPIFSTLQNEKTKLTNTYFQTLHFSIAIHLLVYLAVFLLAPLLVPWYFGASWKSQIFVFQALCFFALLYAWINPLEALLIALNKIEYQLFIYITLTPFLIFAIWFGSKYDLNHTVVNIIIAHLIVSAVTYFVIIKQLMPSAIVAPILKTLILALVSLSPAHFIYPFSTLGSGIIFIITYLCLSYQYSPVLLQYAKYFLKLK